jgi:hypothetical protein
MTAEPWGSVTRNSCRSVSQVVALFVRWLEISTVIFLTL